jgi:Zn-dependent peptidase ImmA (M78 family)
MDRDEVRRRANDLLSLAGIRHPPVDLRAIGLHCQVDIRRTYQLPPEVSGLLYIGPQFPVIMVNAHEDSLRQRFTTCHELWHLIAGSRAVAMKLCYADVGDMPDEERLADAFAAELLMPAGMLEDAWQTERRTSALCSLFRVSPTALRRRLAELELSVREPISLS